MRLWPILDALSIPRCGMHAFRHGHGTLMHSSGASLKVTQAQLRHADSSTTSRYYLHVVDSEQRDAAEKVAQILCPFVARLEVKQCMQTSCVGRGGGGRTHDQRLKRPLLCH